MSGELVPLFERLPEIHRTRDGEQEPPGQLEAYLRVIDGVFDAIHDDIRRLYDDLFVESASDWAVPYLGDLLGTSHLAGDPWTIRADVADTIALRRRKGTLAAIERLTFDLTGWGVHAVELRENLAWSQHLNHLRPDLGGRAGVEAPGTRLAAPRRGGTVPVRDPAILSLLKTPFDPFAHLPDLRPPAGGTIRYNLPNLAIFLWRLSPYRLRLIQPGARKVVTPAWPAGAPADAAKRVVRIDLDPLGRPVRLFNLGSQSRSERLQCCDPDASSPANGSVATASLTDLDQAPGPIIPARLTDDTPAGNPSAYVLVSTFDPAGEAPTIAAIGLQLHLPGDPFGTSDWQFRGANLCAWEAALDAPLLDREIAIDPEIGRVLIGVTSAAEASKVRDNLLVSYTYGAPGPVGAHPIDRQAAPESWFGEQFQNPRKVRLAAGATAFQDALADLDQLQDPLVIEIEDSLVHDLDLAAVQGRRNEAGGPNLCLSRTVIVRAADGQRPIVRLRRPIRVRPAAVKGTDQADQDRLDAVNDHLVLRLEGVFVTRGDQFPAGEPLVARVALEGLELVGCTLDPGGYRQLDGTRAPVLPAIEVRHGHGFSDADETTAFQQTPRIDVSRSIVGAILADDDYTTAIHDSIVDAGAGPGEAAAGQAVGGASDPVAGWGAPLVVDRGTFLGPVRVEQVEGTGGIFSHSLQANNNQQGCIRLSAFAGEADRLPQNVECVSRPDARLRVAAIALGAPGYGQLALSSDFRVLERGPDDDEMGAYGFLRDAHKWRNLQIRYREFMPLGIRPLLSPET
jgi:hypothetical protein